MNGAFIILLKIKKILYKKSPNKGIDASFKEILKNKGFVDYEFKENIKKMMTVKKIMN